MIAIRRTEEFAEWLHRLRDMKGRAKIQVRIDRLAAGNPGDNRSVGDKVTELRIDHGPGYRVYFTRRGSDIVLLLCGGDKSTQDKDIARAKRLAEEYED